MAQKRKGEYGSASRKPKAGRVGGRGGKAQAKKAAPKKRPARRRRADTVQPASRARAARVGESQNRDAAEPVREREDAEVLIPGVRDDDLAEELGEEAVEAATSGQSPAEDNLNQEVPEETGGPFVETTADVETGDNSERRRKK